MSRTLSSSALQALNASETGDVFVILLTIDHADLTIPIRVSSDAVDTISRGSTFIAFPFDLTLPEDSETKSPQARLVIDNIDRQIILAVRSLTSPATVLIEIVRAAAPDSVEAQFVDFKLTNVTYNAQVVEGDLTVEDFTTEPWPAHVFSPALFPGLF